MKKYLLFTSIFVLLFTSIAYAGILAVVTSIATSTGVLIPIVGAILAAVIGKIIPNDLIYKPINKVFYGLGVVMTIGLSRYKWSKPFWNKIIEPFFIDLLNNTIGAAVNGLISGLKSDNN